MPGWQAIDDNTILVSLSPENVDEEDDINLGDDVIEVGLEEVNGNESADIDTESNESIFSGQATSEDEAYSGNYESSKIITADILPTIAKLGDDCAVEGEIQARMLSAGDGNTGEIENNFTSEGSSTGSTSRFKTSRGFISSLSIVTSFRDWADTNGGEAQVSTSGLVCQYDVASGKLIWQQSSGRFLAARFGLVVGFVDDDNTFSDGNVVFVEINKNGAALFPKEYLAVKEEEKVYVAFVDKETLATIDTGAVVLYHENSTMKISFPSNLSRHFGGE